VFTICFVNFDIWATFFVDCWLRAIVTTWQKTVCERLATEMDTRVAEEFRLAKPEPKRPKVSDLKILLRNACKRSHFIGRGLEAVS
jgi:hypothetical protein